MPHHTGTQDKDYNLVSLLYHALQGAETCSQYIEDADQAGDQEAVDCFRGAQEQYRGLADKAKKLLASRL